jgi:hypothetical protein
VSGPSPLANCADGQTRVFRIAEVEPFIAGKPGDPPSMVVVYQQDRFADRYSLLEG